MSAVPVSALSDPMNAYGVAQTIPIDQATSGAVPRKTGAYDTEGVAAPAGAMPASLTFFQSSNSFQQALVLTSYTQKVYGRDTNITSKTGGMAKGERLYAYGVSMKIDAGNQTLNSAANVVSFDQWRRMWGFADISINLGSDEFVRMQARDVPLFAPKVPFTTIGATLVNDISVDGMYDLTINGAPYVFDQQEDFRAVLTLNQGALTALALTVETYITLRLEGIRLKAIRQ